MHDVRWPGVERGTTVIKVENFAVTETLLCEGSMIKHIKVGYN